MPVRYKSRFQASLYTKLEVKTTVSSTPTLQGWEASGDHATRQYQLWQHHKRQVVHCGITTGISINLAVSVWERLWLEIRIVLWQHPKSWLEIRTRQWQHNRYPNLSGTKSNIRPCTPIWEQQERKTAGMNQTGRKRKLPQVVDRGTKYQ